MLTLCYKSRTLLYFSLNTVVVARVVCSRLNKLQSRVLHGSRVRFYSSRMSDSSKMPFNFKDYDCIGFDLDNTICRYKVGNMVKMEYECLANYLIDKRGYADKYLKKPIEVNLDFMLKGLILDVKRGNVLRIAPDARILHASHGTTELTKEEIITYYGKEQRWDITDVFTKNPLHTWNGPLSQNMRTLLDYFDMPAGLVFARAVDTLDEANGSKLNEYNIYAHIQEALQDMFQREHFQLDKGGYFANIKSNPDNYIHKCSTELMQWFKSLRDNKKVLFLITGSNVDFASYTATNSMGTDWRSLFDIVICFAKKPGFFTEKRPFIGLEGHIETEAVNQIQKNQIYTHGNWEGLNKFLKECTNKEEPKIVYIGDNLIQDVYTPSVHTNCDTVAICEELEAEGAFGHDKTHLDKHFLSSNMWGSYFHHENETNSTIWKHIINTHSKLCIPSLEYVAQYPINHNFSPE